MRNRWSIRGKCWSRCGAAAAWLVTAALCGCTDEVGLPADDSAIVRYPIAFAAAPGGTHLFALGSNFDRAYRAGTLRVIETATDTFVAESKVEVPGFASDVALQIVPGPAGVPQVRRAFVTAREDDTLTLVDVAAPTGLSCGKVDARGRCDQAHRLGDRDDDPVGNDPLDVHLAQGPDGKTRVHVVATSDGRVTILELADDATPSLLKAPLRQLDSLGYGRGAHSALTSPWTGRTYVSDSRSSVVHVYRMDPTGDSVAPWKAVVEPAIALPAAGAVDFGRGMALSTDGARLYVAFRSPASVMVIDIAPTRHGPPRNAVLDVLGVGSQPAHVAVAPVGPGGRDLVYVTCYGDDTIWVVDPAVRAPVAVIDFTHAPFGLEAVNVPGKGWQLYVGLFNRHEIAVVPLAAGAPGRHTATHIVKAP